MRLRRTRRRRSTLITNARFNALLAGPGAGVGEGTRATVAELLRVRRPTVLDADALTSFAAEPTSLLDQLHDQVVLTPHDGEFARLFDAAGDRLSRAMAASRASGAVVLLKGNDTVVAAPDGRAVIQPDAPPSPWAVWLAWTWVALLVLVAVAELADWEDLRLALDFQRHY